MEIKKPFKIEGSGIEALLGTSQLGHLSFANSTISSTNLSEDITFSGRQLLGTWKEKVTVSAVQASATVMYNVLDQQVMYYTSDAASDWNVNFSASVDGTVALNKIMAPGQSMIVKHFVTIGDTAYKNTAVQIDSTNHGVTTKWLNGAPITGTSNSVDLYQYRILKTADEVFTVFASVESYS